MSEKELEMEELEPDRVTLTDEEGVEREFDIISTLELDGNEYFALVAVEGDEDEYIILKVVEEDGEEVLITIDDDDEFDRVADAFDNEMMDEIDLDECGYTKADGTVDSDEIQASGIFGVLMDREAAGYTLVNQYSLTTPMNARGSYSNIVFHESGRWFVDYTEKACILMLD